MSITTKSGDEGKTTTVYCNCQSKGDYLFEVLGNLDELISHVGYEVWMGMIIQEQLFTICESLASGKQSACFALPIFDAMCKYVEEELNKKNCYPTDFIHVGTTSEAKEIHIARSVCRRLERSLVRYRDEYGGKFDSTILKAINRLSDVLYLIGCYEEDTIIYVNKRRGDVK